VAPNTALQAACPHPSHLSWEAGHAMHVSPLPPGEPARRGLFDPLQGTASRVCPEASTPEHCVSTSCGSVATVQTPLPLSSHPLSEHKVFRGFIIDKVAEKNQKNEKLLIEKTGRFTRKTYTGKVAIGTRLVHLFHDPTPLCLRGCEG
jgi:hypothetical protein